MPKAKTTAGERATHPAGMFQAVCVDVLDLGYEETQWGDKYKIRLVFETEVPYPVEGLEGNFRLSQKYTLSLHEKSNLSKDLQSWFGKTFTPKQRKEGFEVESVIGFPATLYVRHITGREGDEIAVIESILPKGEKPFAGTGTYQRQEKEKGETNGVPSHPAPVQEPVIVEPEEEARASYMPEDDLPF